jgi:uncharacterized protein (TIGR03118 family)
MHRSVLFVALVSAAGGALVSTSLASCSNSTPAVPEDAAVPSDVVTPSDGAVDVITVDSAAATDAEAGPVVQLVTPTLLFGNNAEAGAANVDPNLVNPWGLAFTAKGVAWISDEGTGVSTVYPAGATAPSLTVTIPPPAAADAGTIARPTGVVFNATTDFFGDSFLFATRDGTISGWASTFDVTTSAVLRVDNSASANYTGLAIVPSSPKLLVAANFGKGTLDVFNTSYVQQTPATGSWTDPSVPAGYSPFNVVAIGQNVYVLYAQPNAAKTVGLAGAGAVSVFTSSGALAKSLIAASDGGALSAPWGLAWAPAGWGSLGGALLVGNFGNGWINAFNPSSGAFLGSLFSGPGQPIAYDGLWSLEFPILYGPDGGIVSQADSGGAPLPLYFTAGPEAGTAGLFGTLSPTP